MVKYVGILNVTPDSFSDGGKYEAVNDALAQAKALFDRGASIVDIGGQSTRPGAPEIGWEVEWSRVEGVLTALKHLTMTTNDNDNHENGFSRISLDTKNPETAQAFLDMEGKILNDVSGFQDARMQELACRADMIIVNHFPGRTIEEVHDQKISSTKKIVEDLLKTKEILLQKGVESHRIVLDPGIGFGKTMRCNWELVEFARLVPGERVLIGASRKRFLDDVTSWGKVYGERYMEWDFELLKKGRFSPEANMLVERIAIGSGAEFLRVHEISNDVNTNNER